MAARNDGVKLCFKLFSQPIMEGAKCRNFLRFFASNSYIFGKNFPCKKGCKRAFCTENFETKFNKKMKIFDLHEKKRVQNQKGCTKGCTKNHVL